MLTVRQDSFIPEMEDKGVLVVTLVLLLLPSTPVFVRNAIFHCQVFPHLCSDFWYEFKCKYFVQDWDLRIENQKEHL